MKVKAAEGLLVPKEDDPRSYYGSEPQDAQATPYIVRRLAAGELLEVDDQDEAPAARRAAKGGAK